MRLVFRSRSVVDTQLSSSSRDAGTNIMTPSSTPSWCCALLLAALGCNNQSGQTDNSAAPAKPTPQAPQVAQPVAPPVAQQPTAPTIAQPNQPTTAPVVPAAQGSAVQAAPTRQSELAKQNGPRFAAISADGRLLATYQGAYGLRKPGEPIGWTRIWDFPAGTLKLDLPAADHVDFIALSPDGNTVAVSGNKSKGGSNVRAILRSRMKKAIIPHLH